MVTCVVLLIGIAFVLGLLTWLGRWKWLWVEWLSTVDHKRVGVMYVLLAVVMLLRGFSDAIMMRSQQALAAGGGAGFLPPEHYDQVFSAHGTIMIFFMAMPFVVGLMNFVVPLQIRCARCRLPGDERAQFLAHRRGPLCSINISLGVGEFARTGWLAYPPLSELGLQPGRGRRLLLVVTADLRPGHLAVGHQPRHDHHAMSDPGMKLGDMPIFTWTALAAKHADRRGVPRCSPPPSRCCCGPLCGPALLPHIQMR